MIAVRLFIALPFFVYSSGAAAWNMHPMAPLMNNIDRFIQGGAAIERAKAAEGQKTPPNQYSSPSYEQKALNHRQNVVLTHEHEASKLSADELGARLTFHTPGCDRFYGVPVKDEIRTNADISCNLGYYELSNIGGSKTDNGVIVNESGIALKILKRRKEDWFTNTAKLSDEDFYATLSYRSPGCDKAFGIDDVNTTDKCDLFEFVEQNGAWNWAEASRRNQLRKPLASNEAKKK